MSLWGVLNNVQKRGLRRTLEIKLERDEAKRRFAQYKKSQRSKKGKAR